MAGIIVTVRLFASLRESVGSDRLELELPLGATAAQAWDAIPGVEPQAPSGTRYALNGEWTEAERQLAGGDELALILPVSGG